MLFIVMLGTVNGSNFTDGVDGLNASVTVLIATFFTVVAIGLDEGIYPMTGALQEPYGILLYNVYPAKVFMGIQVHCVGDLLQPQPMYYRCLYF